MTSDKRVLVVSAHPDDETIGAGGTISRHIDEGDRVFWCVMTKAYTPQWSEEAIRAAAEQVERVRAVLGIEKVFFGGFPTVRLNTVPCMELCSFIQKVVDEVRPQIVYTTPARDLNQDHRIVHEATLVACRPLPGSPVRRVLAYDIATTSRYGYGASMPNVFVDISKYLEKKMEAFACYETEVQPWPHPRSLEGLRLICRERGLSIGVEAAECFELIREII